MSIANYEGGFSDGITIRGVPIAITHPGKVFWVSNSTVQLPNQKAGSNSNSGKFNDPFATIAYALTQCVANRGDVVMVKPGHAESVSSASALAFNVAGVAIIGLGRGTKRPTLTFDTANTATIAVSADNFAIKNFLFVANFLGVVSCFTVGAANSFVIEGCEFKDTSAILNFKSIVTTTVSTDSDYLTFYKNVVKSDATTKAAAMIVVLNTMRGITIEGNRIIQTVAQNNLSQLLSHAALVVTDGLVKDNLIHCVNTDSATGALLVSTTATTGSGWIIGNYVKALDTASAILVTATAVQWACFNNYYLGEATSLSGFLLPAADTDS